MAKVILHEINSDRSSVHRAHVRSFINSVGIILLYFPLSIGLTFYQRWFLKGFHFPLLVVMCHLLTKFLVAAFLRTLWQLWTGRQRVRLDWPNVVRKVAPMGFVSGLDIAFSNWGLEIITVSLYTMTKSSTILFILFFALLFRLEEKTWSLVLTVVMIAGGLLLFTYKAAQFDLVGFLLVLFASFSSGLRWTLAQLVMRRSELGLSNPVDLLYHVQPWMFLSVLPFFILFEGGVAVSVVQPPELALLWTRVGYILLGSLLALAMELSEYLVVSNMSSLTLSVAGIFKEVCTVTLAIEWNGDIMSRLNFLGLLLCLAGIALHVARRGVKEAYQEPRTRKASTDEASARFLGEMTESEDEDNQEDSSTEVLFSVLHSRGS